MCFPRQLIYIGSDNLQFAFLQSQFPDLPVIWFGDLPEDFSLENWNRVIVLDAGPRGSDLLIKLKRSNAGIPVILLVGPNDLPLTQISGAFSDGAELMLHKPLPNPAVLVECIRDCCRRLDHWWYVLNHYPSRSEHQDGAVESDVDFNDYEPLVALS